MGAEINKLLYQPRLPQTSFEVKTAAILSLADHSCGQDNKGLFQCRRFTLPAGVGVSGFSPRLHLTAEHTSRTGFRVLSYNLSNCPKTENLAVETS